HPSLADSCKGSLFRLGDLLGGFPEAIEEGILPGHRALTPQRLSSGASGLREPKPLPGGITRNKIPNGPASVPSVRADQVSNVVGLRLGFSEHFRAPSSPVRGWTEAQAPVEESGLACERTKSGLRRVCHEYAHLTFHKV